MTAIDIVHKRLQKGPATHAQLDRLLRSKDQVTYNLPDVIYQLRQGASKRKPVAIETVRFHYRGKLCTQWYLR